MNLAALGVTIHRNPDGKPLKNRQGKHLNREMYDSMLSYLRSHPGDISGCAESTGINIQAVQRTWDGEIRTNKPWAVPIIEVLRQEQRAREAKAAEDLALAQAAQEQMQRKREADEAEAKVWDDLISKTTRGNIMRGLGSIASILPGLSALAKRTNAALEDPNSNIPPVEAIKLLNSFATAVHRLGEASSTLVAVERIKQNLPTNIVSVDITQVTVEDAEREIELATQAINRARGLRLLPGGKTGT